MTKTEILKYVGYGADYLIKNTVAGDALYGADVRPQHDGFTDEALRWYKSYYSEHCVEKSVLYDGVKETLGMIKERNDISCVLTNKPEAVTLRSLEIFGIRDYFFHVLCPENLTKGKPSPEGIFKCMEVTGAAAEYTVMIGDSAADIDAGNAAGVHTCGVLSGIGDRELMLKSKPEICIDNRHELVIKCDAIFGKIWRA